MKALPAQFFEQSDLSALQKLRVTTFFEQQVARRSATYGRGHFVLACYAAFPAVLTADLLHKIWLNFNKYKSADGQEVVMHAVTPTDLLLSPLVEEIGFELFEMPEPIRRVFLKFLQKNAVADRSDGFGFYPIGEVAAFLYDYARFDFTPENKEDNAFREAQEWTALSYLNPSKAIEKIAISYQSATANHPRYRDALEKMSRRFALQIVRDEKAIPTGFKALTTLTSVMRDVLGKRDPADLEVFLKEVDKSDASLADEPSSDPMVISVEVPIEVGTLISKKNIETAVKQGIIHPLQWNLKKTEIKGTVIEAHINVEEAWKTTRGAGITVAIIGDGVDILHPEFVGRIVSPRDFTTGKNDMTGMNKDDSHDTALAGIIGAAGLNDGVCGVAPQVKIMPIRLKSGLGSAAESGALIWAAEQGADVIVVAFGPADGNWWDANDPLHTKNMPLPDSTRLAMEQALQKGRNGKGCIICIAAGNGNESTDYDGYVSFEGVIAAGAHNDRNTRSIYSDYGKAVCCSLPSNDFAYAPFKHAAPITDGIRTTDRVGKLGYSESDYSNSFGGTTAAAAQLAGIAALMLAANPDLTWQQVKDLVKKSCVKIDEKGGEYDSEGHSLYYGYGRLDAGLAVRNALGFREEIKPATDENPTEKSAGQTALKTYLETVQALIEEDELKEAVEAMLELENLTSAGLRDQIVMQSANFNQLEKSHHRGLLAFEEYSRIKNQIRYALLQLLKDFSQKMELKARFGASNQLNFSTPSNQKLEKIIGGQNNLIKISWLEKGIKNLRAICRVRTADGELGLGFLTRDGYVFTVNHLLNNRSVADESRVEFNFDASQSGENPSSHGVIYSLDASDFVFSPPEELDFSRVKVIDNPSQPLSQWGFVELETEAVPHTGDPIALFQFSNLGAKQLDLSDRQALSTRNQYLFYEPQPASGSSGTPVFNADWKVVGIHHAYRSDSEGGLLIDAKGNKRGASRGVQIQQIVKFLEKITAKKQTKASEELTLNEELPEKQDEKLQTNLPSKWIALYAEEDREAAAMLNKHLSVLKATKKITFFRALDDVFFGDDFNDRYQKELADAQLIIALITADLMASDEWFSRLLEAMQSGREVVPILVKPTDFEGTGLEKLEALPTSGRWISSYQTPDEAWLEVIAALKKRL